MLPTHTEVLAMGDNTSTGSPQRRAGLLRDQVQLVKRKDSDRYEIVPILDQLSLEKGFFVVICACQLLVQKNDRIILVGIAGPSGAGKSVFIEKMLNFMPSISVISMDNYNDVGRIIDGNFDGGVHFDLVKRVLRDIQRAGQEPEEIIHQISETEWVTDGLFIISPRITFEGSVRLLGGLMALGYTIAAILKRNSHDFSDDRVSVKIDWLEQLNRHYVQVLGRDRLVVRDVANQVDLEGSYVPRTYIEQIQLENDEVMALPDDLKTKLNIDDDVVSSPREALSKASSDKVIMRKNTVSRDQTVAKLMRFKVGTKHFDGRALDSNALLLQNQGAISYLSEQISILTERTDEFMSQMEELNAKLNANKVSANKQNLGLQAESCNGSLYFSGSGNCGFYSSTSSISQLVKGSVMKEMNVIDHSQNQIMHQLDKLSDFLHTNMGLGTYQRRRVDGSKGRNNVSLIGSPLIILFSVGGISAMFLRCYSRY